MREDMGERMRVLESRRLTKSASAEAKSCRLVRDTGGKVVAGRTT
ncbi:MAG: hypothetical protein ACLTMP_14635 [Eggerthella lenta]